MNTLQLCRQVKKLLQDRTWTIPNGTASSNKVFAPSSVFITAGQRLDDDAFSNRRTPMAQIYVLSSTYVHTHEIRQELGIRLAVSVPGDAVGEVAIMGGNPTDGLTNPQESSKGRGLLEIAEQVQLTLAYLSRENGVNIQLRTSSAISPSVRDDNQYVAMQDYTFEAYVSDGRYYPNGSLFRFDSDTDTLSWKNPPSRFDFYRMMVRRGNSTSSAAPNTVNDGTEVYTGTGESTGITPGYKFSLFATYDDLNSSPSADRVWSTPLTVTT